MPSGTELPVFPASLSSSPQPTAASAVMASSPTRRAMGFRDRLTTVPPNGAGSFGTGSRHPASTPNTLPHRGPHWHLTGTSLAGEAWRAPLHERLHGLAEIAAGQESGVPRGHVAQPGRHPLAGVDAEHVLDALHHQR